MEIRTLYEELVLHCVNISLHDVDFHKQFDGVMLADNLIYCFKTITHLRGHRISL